MQALVVNTTLAFHSCPFSYGVRCDESYSSFHPFKTPTSSNSSPLNSIPYRFSSNSSNLFGAFSNIHFKNKINSKKPRKLLPCHASVSNFESETDYYAMLGVEKKVEKTELKRAYRKLALQYHPDVSSAPDAHEKFIALSKAYEVLIDDKQRSIYDRLGIRGLENSQNASSGAAWDAFDTWDEFKPFVRRSRKGDARNAAAMASDSEDKEFRKGEGEGTQRVAQVGDVVEYPLSDAAKARHCDGRIKGVGFVVSRNIDRGDRKKLPLENLDLVELEALYKEWGEEEWRVDTMEPPAFAHLSQLRILSSKFDQLHDTWILVDQLSEDCGSPEYEKETYV